MTMINECKIFNCDKKHGNHCCFYCSDKKKCKNRCLNHPNKCKLLVSLENKEGKHDS